MSSNPFDQPDFEGDLPADFAALGEQLQADAQRLSSVYPACRAPRELPKELPKELNDALAVKHQHWWLRRELSLLAASAAVVLLVAGLVTIAYSPWSQRTAQHPADPTPIAKLPDNQLVQTPSAPAENAVEVQPVSYRPMAEFNGPELEGLLDLMQENPQAAATSISF